MTSTHDGPQRLLDLLDPVNTAMLAGDPGPWKALLSHRDDLIVFGAQGGYARGRQDVTSRFERAATSYGRGGQSRRHNLATWIAADLACTVDLEHHETRLQDASDVVTFSYRTTHLLRREDDEWRIVLRHADPLDTLQGPAVAHAAARSSESSLHDDHSPPPGR